MPACPTVDITTGARLHFGPLTNGRRKGRLFGGIGMMLDRPSLQITAEQGDTADLQGPAPLIDKARGYLERYADRSGQSLTSLRLKIAGDTALHSGLGVGTQLGMALAQSIALLTGEGSLPVAELARRVGRGKRSALGVHGFARGGFLVDGGKIAESALGTLLCRVDVPDTWRVLLITPQAAQGLSGDAEIAAFQRLEPMPEQVTAALCRLVLLDILPALHEGEFAPFADALYDYGCLVGDYFAEIQGGRYAHPQLLELIPWLRDRGLRGVGQTSWGPTAFAFCRNDSEADSLRMELESAPIGAGCRLEIARPLNTGAAIQIGATA